MKKLMTVLAIAIFLVGCSSKDNTTKTSYATHVDDADSVVIEGNNISITKQDVYGYLMDNLGGDFVLDKALSIVADQVITDEDEINEQLQELISTYINILGEDGLENYAVDSLGYASYEEYEQTVLIPGVKQNLLVSKYIQDNYETLATEYAYKKISMITFDVESDAFEANTALQNGEMTIDEAFNKYNVNTSQTEPSLGIVSTQSSSLDASIINLLPTFEHAGYHYGTPITLSDGEKWALVYVEETDLDILKDEIIENLATLSVVTTKCEVYYLNEYNFKVYEKNIENQIKALEGNYLGTE